MRAPWPPPEWWWKDDENPEMTYEIYSEWPWAWADMVIEAEGRVES